MGNNCRLDLIAEQFDEFTMTGRCVEMRSLANKQSNQMMCITLLRLAKMICATFAAKALRFEQMQRHSLFLDLWKTGLL